MEWLVTLGLDSSLQYIVTAFHIFRIIQAPQDVLFTLRRYWLLFLCYSNKFRDMLPPHLFNKSNKIWQEVGNRYQLRW